MIPFVNCRPVLLKCIKSSFLRSYSLHSTRHADPLRILFCGAEEFSAASLRRLHEEHQKDPSFIASIDVVCKEGRKAGRGMKTVRHVPIKEVAENLSLPLHQISTFTGWSPPAKDENINLVIAVSFGLLVPPRILGYAKYGGLNLHPSLLPDLRGPAPLQYAVIQGRTKTGITLQTLHPQQFDGGLILAQESFPLPNNGDCTALELRDSVAPRAADFLVENLKRAVFVDPTGLTPSVSESHAPKLQKEDAEIDWLNWPAQRILQTQKALWPLWNTIMFEDLRYARHQLRVQWGNFELCNTRDEQLSLRDPGTPFLATLAGENVEKCLINTCDDQTLAVTDVTLEGRPRNESATRIMKLITKHKLRPSTLRKDEEIRIIALTNREASGGHLTHIGRPAAGESW